MDIYHTIIRPVVTEKSTKDTQFHSEKRGGAYAFEVHPRANKHQIRDAVEKIYGVRVMSVRTSTRKGKPRRYRFRWSQSSATKRATVVLHRDSHIDLF